MHETTGFSRDLAMMKARLPVLRKKMARMTKYLVPSLQNQGGGVNAVGTGVDLRQAR